MDFDYAVWWFGRGSMLSLRSFLDVNAINSGFGEGGEGGEGTKSKVGHMEYVQRIGSVFWILFICFAASLVSAGRDTPLLSIIIRSLNLN